MDLDTSAAPIEPAATPPNSPPADAPAEAEASAPASPPAEAAPDAPKADAAPAGAPSTDETPKADQASGAAPASEPAAPPAEPPRPAPDGRVVELKRSNRAAVAAKEAAETRAKELEAKLARLAPLESLLDLATQDPARWIEEMAGATGLKAESVLDVVAKRGAGEDRALTVEEQLAAVTKEFREFRESIKQEQETAKSRSQEAQQAQAVEERVANVEQLVKSEAQSYPLCAAKGRAGAQEIFDVVASKWKDLPDAQKARLKTDPKTVDRFYKWAARKVERRYEREADLLAAARGWRRDQPAAQTKDSPAPAGAPAGSRPAPQSKVAGLSNDALGASPPPDPNRILSDDEIRELGRRMLG